MRLFSWECVFCILLIGHAARGNDIISCDPAIRIRCTHYKIVIVNVNITSRLASKFLEQCNAQGECFVSNAREECVHINYRCKKVTEFQQIEITELSEVRLSTKSSWFSLMSKGYRKGKYKVVQDISCSLRPEGKHASSKMTMQVTVNEFAPFANSPDFCLYVNNDQFSSVCSGSHKIHTYYEPIESTNGWRIKMKLTRPTTILPQIRFWIDILLSPNDNTMYNMECNSQQVRFTVMDVKVTEVSSPQTIRTGQTKESISVPVIIAAVLGTLLLFAITALAICSNKLCRSWKCTKMPSDDSQETSSEQGHDDPYVDLDGIFHRQDEQRAQGSMLSIPSVLLADQASPSLMGSRIQERALPSPPREIKTRHVQTAKPHILQDADNGPEESVDNAYLSSGTGSGDIGTAGANRLQEGEICPYSMDQNYQEDENQDLDDISSIDDIKNEYLGLSQETLNDSDDTSRSSSGTLYTLLCGKARSLAVNLENTNPDKVSDSTRKTVDDNDIALLPGDISFVKKNADDQVDDKDENGYLVLLAGKVQPKQEAGGKNVEEMKAGKVLSVSGDKDEHGYLVLLPGEISTSHSKAEGQTKPDDREDMKESASTKDTDEHGYLVLLPNYVPTEQENINVVDDYEEMSSARAVPIPQDKDENGLLLLPTDRQSIEEVEAEKIKPTDLPSSEEIEKEKFEQTDDKNEEEMQAGETASISNNDVDSNVAILPDKSLTNIGTTDYQTDVSLRSEN